MTRSESYNTKQKDLIINIIQKQKQAFTIKDIYSQVKDKTGLTTIYRLVDKLVQDGRLSKSIGKDNITYYQCLLECDAENHFYLKCDKCGTLIHIDCDCIGDLFNHILNEHNFKPSKDHIIINGICNNCRSKGIPTNGI